MKLRLVVLMHTSAWLQRPKVSTGPPRQAAQLGGAGGRQPAALKMALSVRPLTMTRSKPCSTSVVAGTRKVGTATWRPSSSWAAATKSSVLPPVQEPMQARSGLAVAAGGGRGLVVGRMGQGDHRFQRFRLVVMDRRVGGGRSLSRQVNGLVVRWRT